ncbi:N-acyl homoserine lactonase family protein [Halegenticoccus soli]|uniref:N-acyl homoserine lactonase family protein n=1 Tax=Halegenticoccus soli TaxID=1985678 RepID=UPI000C6EE85D|nr:N-acyl homoserine lactonase family protein [Halegenticoccus soli]
MTDASVHLLDRGRVRADVNYVVDGYVMADAENPRPEHEIGEFVVWNAVVDHPEMTVLWDTGSHPDAGSGYWPEPLYGAFEHVDADEHRLEDDLDAAGYSLSDLDAVVTSHLHLDHAGGLYNFDGSGVPIYVHREELKYAYYSAKTTEGSVAYLASDFDRDLNWNVIHRDRRTLAEGFELIRAPGHTPGLLAARIDRDGGTVLLAGDAAYVDANYADELPMGPGLLWCERRWLDTVRKLKEEERVHDADVLYGHDLERFESFDGGWG